MDRRRFLQATAAGAGAAAMPGAGLQRFLTGLGASKIEHYVPADKALDVEWVRALYRRGEPRVYRGAELDTLAMPVGGIGCGQLYLTGDGRWAEWNLANERRFSGYGADNYDFRMPRVTVEHGFRIQVEVGGGRRTLNLDRRGFPGVEFRGEYPVARVRYADESLPVEVVLTAFSPFAPLDAAFSAQPVSYRAYRVRNRTGQTVRVALEGWMEHPLVPGLPGEGVLYRREEDGRQGVAGAYRRFFLTEVEAAGGRSPRVLADFEGGSYGDWQIEGEAFGEAPASGTLPSQQPVTGFCGKGLVNSFLGGDGPTGSLLSPPFPIDRPWLNALVGGGQDAERTTLQVLVDGEVVAAATGSNREELRWRALDLRPWQGREGRIRIVDAASGGWGHINADQIQLEDAPRQGPGKPLREQQLFGEVAFALLPPPPEPPGAPGRPDRLFKSGAEGGPARFGLARTVEIPPGGEAELVFVLAWHFPNAPHGVQYATRHADVSSVLRAAAAGYQEARRRTMAWHDTWYASSLPRWLLDRLHAPVANLATGLTEWRADGRFWAWEGVGCCAGTCTHVWNYAQAHARLFPELARSVRHHQDFGEGFDEDTGLVGFRGNRAYAADGQCGSILKAYREHLCSPDDRFLRAHWPRIRRALAFSMARDDAPGDGGQDRDEAGDGLIEDAQHNTYDIEFHGANPFVGFLYLAALRAGEEMAARMGDAEFGSECRRRFERGSRRIVEYLFEGEYFLQRVDLERHPRFQVGRGCLADQVFGQGWAHMLGLGHLAAPEAIQSALRAVWTYNWAPDTGPQNAHHRPERWFARRGEKGLFTCTWPKSDFLAGGVRYKNEVWTGIEYQVAGHMIREGLVEEGLAIVRGIDERYDGRRHNPWNEVECGDHYARALASWGVFLSLCGFEYDGPAGVLGFAPVLEPEDFAAAFTAAEGWGLYRQAQRDGGVDALLELQEGTLALRELRLAPPSAGVRRWAAEAEADGAGVVAVVRPLPGRPDRLAVRFGEGVRIAERLSVRLQPA